MHAYVSFVSDTKNSGQAMPHPWHVTSRLSILNMYVYVLYIYMYVLLDQKNSKLQVQGKEGNRTA